MADLSTDVEAALTAVQQVQTDVQNLSAPDPDGDALKAAAVAYAVSQGYSAPAPADQLTNEAPASAEGDQNGN